MELKDNQFLKIRAAQCVLDFEVYEAPQNGRRAKRWHISVPMSHLVNRHQKDSKIEFLTKEIAMVKYGFFYNFYQDEYYKTLTSGINELVKVGEKLLKIGLPKPIETRLTF